MKFKVLIIFILFLLITVHCPLSTVCRAADTQTPGLGDQIVREVQSRIAASGRKMWEVKYTWSHYLDPRINSDFENSFAMYQELQFRLSGKVGDRITVNVEYDDTQQKKQKISVIYTGEGREATGIQEVNFGDQVLSLPGTEFVAYNKQLFGLSVKGQYEKFRYYFVGSQTKGYSETREFRGKSEFKVVDIRDISYYTRKYYILRHINQGREKVYIDDRNASNNTANTFYFQGLDMVTNPVSPDTISGYFDPAFSGVDYVIDYGTAASDSTVISFSKGIDQNFVLLVYDMDLNNTFAIKDDLGTETRTSRYELKNYYYLGYRKIIQNDPNFILEVWDSDKARHPVYLWPNTAPAGESYTAKIDYDFGIIHFVDSTGRDVRPFAPEVYLPSNPVTTREIHAEFKYSIQALILRPYLVEGSERVYLNGSLLRKDSDYTIDYDSGWLSFLREEMITEDSVIKVDYEYMPFGGQYVETLLGMRGELPLSPDFSIGTTYLYSGTPSPNEIPSVRSTPKSHQVVDVDMQLDPKSLISRIIPGLEKVPFSTSMNFEGAYSWKDPNTFKKAMVDDMEGAKLQVSVPMTDTNSWRISSAPTGESLGLRGLIGGGVFNLRGAEEGHDPNLTTPKSIVLDYSLADSNWVAICYPISKYSQDYSQYNNIEFWVKDPVPNVKVFFELGMISEDVDGRGGFDTDVYSGSAKLWSKGQPKTEDTKMADGKLNPDEDAGWTFYSPGGSSAQIGANNGRLDGEDLDGDGQLNAFNQKIHTLGGYFAEFDSSGYKIGESGSWKLYRIPFSRQVSGDTDWAMVKNIRIWVKNESGGAKSGSLQMDSLSVVGSKWTNVAVGGLAGINTFSAESRNSVDNISGDSLSYYKDPRYYVPDSSYDEDEDGLNDYFEELHPNLEEDLRLVVASQIPKEQSMALVYRFSEECTGSVTQKFTTALNFTDYKRMKFWLFVTSGSSGGTFFIRFGMDDNNYYQQNFALSSEKDWEIKSVELGDVTTLVRSATMTVTEPLDILYNIKQITLGVYDTNTFGRKKEIWINELYLDESGIKEGYALKAGLNVNIDNGFVGLGASYRKLSHTFETLGVASAAEDNESFGGSWSVLLSRLIPSGWGISLPYSGAWSQTRTQLDPNTAKDVPRYRLGLRNVIAQSHFLNFGQTYLPSITGSYTHAKIDSDFKGSEAKEIQQSYSASMIYSYAFPRWLWYALSVKPSYSYSSSLREVSIGPAFVDTNNTCDHASDFLVSMGFQPVAQVNIIPQYKLRNTGQQASVNAPLGDMRPLSRNQNLGISTSTTYFKGVSPSASLSEVIDENYFISVTDTKKNASGSATVDFNASVSPREWFSVMKFVNFYYSFRMNANVSYESLDKTIEPGDINMDIWQALVNLRDTFTFTLMRKASSNQKNHTLSANFYLWDPLSASANMSFGTDESQNQGSFNTVNNLGYGGSARLDINQAFPELKKSMESSNLMGSFNHRISETLGSSKTSTMTPNFNWQVRWTSAVNQNYSFNWNMETTQTGAYTRFTNTMAPSVRTDYTADFPLVLAIPFFKEWKLANRFDLNNTTSHEFRSVEEDVLKLESTNKFSTTTGLSYNAAENLRLTFGHTFIWYANAQVPTQDYISHSIAFRGEIRF